MLKVYHVIYFYVVLHLYNICVTVPLFIIWDTFASIFFKKGRELSLNGRLAHLGGNFSLSSPFSKI